MKVDKPWGHEEIWARTDRYVGKVLFVRAGCQLSRQYHEVKDETMRVESGKIELELDAYGAIDAKRRRDLLTLGPGDAIHISPGTIHRLRAVEDSRVYEVSTPELDDVVRLEDEYGRSGTNVP